MGALMDKEGKNEDLRELQMPEMSDDATPMGKVVDVFNDLEDMRVSFIRPDDLNAIDFATTYSPLREVLDLFGDMELWLKGLKQSDNGLEQEEEVDVKESSKSSKLTLKSSIEPNPELISLLLILASVFGGFCLCCILCWVSKRRRMGRVWMEVNASLPKDDDNVKYVYEDNV